MEKSVDKEKRVAKTNKHFEIYLQYVKMYNVLKLKWTIQRSYSTEVQNIWHDMTRKLNGCGGPVRDVTHWKKVFTEWKSHTRRKLKCNKPLNDIEKQLVELTGLTSNPERKKKVIKIYKNKALIDNSNKQDVDSKDNGLTIKTELLDESADDDNNFTEQEEETSSDETLVDSKEKLVKKNERDKCQAKSALDKQKNHNSQMKLSQSPMDMDDVSKDTSNRHSSDIAIQVDQDSVRSLTISGALQSLANAVNRYCDIVERRIF